MNDEEIHEALARAYSGRTDAAFDAALPEYRDAYFEDTETLLPVVRRVAEQRAAEELDDFAALIDRGPTFSLPPSIFSAMARERAEDTRATALTATPNHGRNAT